MYKIINIDIKQFPTLEINFVLEGRCFRTMGTGIWRWQLSKVISRPSIPSIL